MLWKWFEEFRGDVSDGLVNDTSARRDGKVTEEPGSFKYKAVLGLGPCAAEGSDGEL